MRGLEESALIAVLGTGAMGSGIAQVAAMAGHDVVLYDGRPNAAETAKAAIVAGLTKLVGKGRLSADACAAAEAHLIVVSALEEIAPAALVIEAIVEDLAAKQDLFRQVERIVSDAAVLATNTSSISITAIAAGLGDPGRLAGMHFFNPAAVMKLVEIVAGLGTREEVLHCLAETAERWGKIPVRARSTPGFIVNRIARPFYGEAIRLLEEGAATERQLDRIYRECGGFRMGPFELMDMIGHDVNYAVTCEVYAATFQDARYRPSITQRELLAAGWLGRKSGRGFYDYGTAGSHAAEGADHAGIPVRAALPEAVIFAGEGERFSEIAALCEEAGGTVLRQAGAGNVLLPGVYLAQTDGRTATHRVAHGEPRDLVLFDHCADLRSAPTIVLAKADQADDEALAAAAEFFRALGKDVCVVEDTPGLVLMRTLAMLVDEAVSAVEKRIASAQDIEIAMVSGVNYPRGLLEWGDRIGAAALLAVLDNLRSLTGDSRYSACGRLRRCAESGRPLLSNPGGQGLSGT